MPASTLTVALTGPGAGAGNLSYVTAHYRKTNDSSPGGDEDRLAFVLVSAALTCARYATDATVLSASTRPVGDPIGGGSTDVPWDAGMYEAVRQNLQAENPPGLVTTALNGPTNVPPGIGGIGGPIAAAGIGITVQGTSASAGRKGRKRMYLPFASEAAISTQGGIEPTVLASVKASMEYFLRSYTLNAVQIGPISIPATSVEFVAVSSVPSPTEAVLTGYKVSTLPCRLRTRTR